MVDGVYPERLTIECLNVMAANVTVNVLDEEATTGCASHLSTTTNTDDGDAHFDSTLQEGPFHTIPCPSGRGRAMDGVIVVSRIDIRPTPNNQSGITLLKFFRVTYRDDIVTQFIERVAVVSIDRRIQKFQIFPFK